MVLPGITPTPPVMTRVGIPSVWESTAVNIRLERMAQSFHFPVVEPGLH
jgi:hypothetical protein